MKRKHTKQPAAQVPAPQPRREVARLSPDPEQGLTLHQVKERQQNGWANDPVDSPTKTVGQIVRENVFTFFNFIFVVLAALLGVGLGVLVAFQILGRQALGTSCLISLGLYLAGCFLGTILGTVRAVNRKPLELLQVKE